MQRYFCAPPKNHAGSFLELHCDDERYFFLNNTSAATLVGQPAGQLWLLAACSSGVAATIRPLMLQRRQGLRANHECVSQCSTATSPPASNAGRLITRATPLRRPAGRVSHRRLRPCTPSNTRCCCAAAVLSMPAGGARPLAAAGARSGLGKKQQVLGAVFRHAPGQRGKAVRLQPAPRRLLQGLPARQPYGAPRPAGSSMIVRRAMMLDTMC